MTEEVKKFLGKAPYNTDVNIVKGDPFYLKSLYKKYGEEVINTEIKKLRSSN